jgi:hypothetical protein
VSLLLLFLYFFIGIVVINWLIRGRGDSFSKEEFGILVLFWPVMLNLCFFSFLIEMFEKLLYKNKS